MLVISLGITGNIMGLPSRGSCAGPERTAKGPANASQQESIMVTGVTSCSEFLSESREIGFLQESQTCDVVQSSDND
jgi:hypothetical protein